MDCRKHEHQGNRGVCACCLRERLSLLPDTTSYYTINLSSSSTTTISPVKEYHRRSGSMTMMSFAVREALSGKLIKESLGGGGLKKSRSMAHVPSHDPYNNIVGDSSRSKKLKSTKAKVSGFWRKLFHLKGKGGGADVGGGLVASRQRVY
ncbi:Uncharacterized protein Rs2_27357 [Raphanus sativus]|uniref:Uncharacterized protein LOC108809278 n=1 Tax=Raphanus sativus TaxID=3726 RepID=A0A6J0JMX2_RAPSA|nr:uncharacterized protein LOC108809278 [Raphanus sativus]KAJ4887609.1 Uncharacterized protein Rs2_27357 [Raphanus sativus]